MAFNRSLLGYLWLLYRQGMPASHQRQLVGSCQWIPGVAGQLCWVVEIWVSPGTIHQYKNWKGLVLHTVTFYRLPTYFFLYFSNLPPYFLSLPLVPLPQDCPIVLSWSLLPLSDHSQPHWLTVTPSDSFWLLMTHTDSSWLTMTPSDLLWLPYLPMTHSDSSWFPLTHNDSY